MVAFNESGQGYFIFSEFENNEVVGEFFDTFFSAKVANTFKERLFNVLNLHSKFLNHVRLDNIKSIDWNSTDRVFEVRFFEGDWYHYTLDGKWY